MSMGDIAFAAGVVALLAVLWWATPPWRANTPLTKRGPLESLHQVIHRKQLVYNGALSDYLVDSCRCMLKTLPCVLEIRRLPANHVEWWAANIPEITVMKEDDVPGTYYEHRYRPMGMVHKYFATGNPEAFLFLHSPADKAAFLRDHADLVIDSNPFKTVI